MTILRVQQVPRHFLRLVRQVGFFRASITAFSAISNVLKGDSRLTFSSGRLLNDQHSDDSKAPHIAGAPKGWGFTSRLLIDQVEKNRHLAIDDSYFSRRVNELRPLFEKSGNRPDEAQVTILIPAFNSYLEVCACLESIVSFPTAVNFKIVVADDSSPKCNFSALNQLRGVRVHRQPVNCGYVLNVNSALRKIDTEFVLTLNQDVVALPGFLDGLIELMDSRPSIGVVGPTVLDQSFRIREAGGLIFREAHAAHRGRGEHFFSSHFSYSSQVDYISGCALLTRTSLWNELGGLDTSLAPAYYDDTDFCLRASSHGSEVWVSSAAFIVHFEGTSMGRDVNDTSSLKSFQERNRQIVAKSHPQLAHHTDIKNRPWPVNHRVKRPSVVCIFQFPPKPWEDGGSVDYDLFVKYLLNRDVSVSALFLTDNSPVSTWSWRTLGIRCSYFGSIEGNDFLEDSSLIISFGIAAGMAYSRSRRVGISWIHYSGDCTTRRLQEMNSTNASHPMTSPEANRWHLGFPRDELAMWSIEKKIFEDADAVVLVSTEDIDFVQDKGAQGRWIHLPILRGSLPVSSPALPSTKNISFVGAFYHSPNPDAIEYFISEVWPLVYPSIPDSQFLIWGSNYTDEFSRKCESVPGVSVRGWFASWQDVIAETRVFVSPLRFGAGMKGKVVTAILEGRPVVGTSISFDGLEKHLLASGSCRDEPAAMATSLMKALRSDEFLMQLLDSQRRVLNDQFSPSTERRRIDEILDLFLPK